MDPNPTAGDHFGAAVVPLSTGNVVITSPLDDTGGTDAGAVYLFNGATGDLMLHFCEHANLSAEEIRELEQLLKKMKARK